MRQIVIPGNQEGSMAFKEFVASHHDFTADYFPKHAYGWGIVDDMWKIQYGWVLQSFHFPGSYLVSGFGVDPKIFFAKKLLKDSLHVAFEEPFSAHRLSMILNEKDTMAMGVAQRFFGARIEGTIKDHFNGNDGVLFGLTEQELTGE